MSKIEVNTVDVQCGSTLTLGSSGKTVTLATGASQTGFGRTGTVDWCATAKTSPLTAESGKGYFVNTTGGAVTVTLPSSPSAGDIVSIKDYAGTAASNNITIGRGGSKLAGGCGRCGTIDTNNAFVTLIYVDGTKGWLPTDDSNSDISGALTFISASGGTVTTSGDYKIHTFTSSGTFTVCTAGAGPVLNTAVSYAVVAGGGGGGWCTGGGGGAGGFREAKVSGDPYTASPLAAGTGITVTAQGYPITVGAGGSGGGSPGACGGATGSASIFSTITSAGGGGAGSRGPSPVNGKTGGSGGGGANGSTTNAAGNTPPVSPPQGQNGGTGDPGPANYTGGGGGATAAGQDGPAASGGGDGGAGATSSITASPVARAGGGGGGNGYPNLPGGSGGAGGGGTGAGPSGGQTTGTANTGGGGGGGSHPSYPTVPGAAGGSGTVIIRYKYQ